MLRPDITDKKETNTSTFDGSFLHLSKYNVWVRQRGPFFFDPTPSTIQRVQDAVELVKQATQSQRSIYGVTTGFGGMSNQSIGCEEAEQLQSNLLSFLAAGVGPEIDPVHTRGAMLLRANVLMQGYSGIRMELIQRLTTLFENDAIPVVREHGSIGASGDLIPLSTIARVITGHSNHVRVRIDNQSVDGQETLRRFNWQPLPLQPKEGLALVNGTSFSTAVAANSILAATDCFCVAFVIQAILMRSLCVNTEPFSELVHRLKPHPGQIWSAQQIQSLLASETQLNAGDDHAQDRYSLRCFPQYCGPIVEGLARIRRVVETEMNSVSDNPLVDSANDKFYQSGNFLGQYIATSMDELRRHLALLAKHLDVQIASLVAPEFNRGLSASLAGNNQQSTNMGLKGLQICGNSIVPLLAHAANPITEHFPTHAEQFNQNINGLSWGSANLAWRSVGNLQHYLAVASLFAVQSIDLRAKQALGHFDGRALLTDTALQFYESIGDIIDARPNRERPLIFNDGDRWLEDDLQKITADIAHDGQLLSAVAPVSKSLTEYFENSL